MTSCSITKRILENVMESKEFVRARKELGRTQKQVAELLAVSLKAVHSYEQGWRNIPVHVERQLLFLVLRKKGNHKTRKPCWVIKRCPSKRKQRCPAWEFQSGDLCWFINGTICDDRVQVDWREKMTMCRSCKVFTA